MKHHVLAATLLGAAWILSGCVVEPAPPSVPAPMAETIPKPPVTAIPLIWQPGHWQWTGSSYSWTPGQYVTRGGHGELWMPGYWERTGSGWVWHPPQWV